MAAALPWWSRLHQVARPLLGTGRRREGAGVSLRRITSWQQRQLRVRSLLARDPQATMSWYWRAHERVLSFMLQRYASAAGTGPPAIEEPGPAGLSTPQVAASLPRTLPGDLVPAPTPLRPAPDPAIIERARSHLQDIAGANLAADKPPPPIFVPPRRRTAISLPRHVGPPPRWLACLVGGAVLLQVPIMVACAALGQTRLGVGVGLAIVLAAIIVALGYGKRAAEPEAPPFSPPPRTCPHCAYDLRHIPEGRCPECGRPP